MSSADRKMRNSWGGEPVKGTAWSFLILSILESECTELEGTHKDY